jgi:hypothetical protein
MFMLVRRMFSALVLSIGLVAGPQAVVPLPAGAAAAKPIVPPDGSTVGKQAPLPPGVDSDRQIGDPATVEAEAKASKAKQRDPEAPAPLAEIGTDDPANMDPSTAPKVGTPAKRKTGNGEKNAKVPASSGTGGFDNANDPEVKAGEFVSVRMPKKKGKDKVNVAVSVRGEDETSGLGGQKLSFTLDRTDSGSDDEEVEVTINYDAFRDTYGSDWATRVRFVKYPDCQGQKGCNTPVEVIPATNDLENGVLTATIALKAAPRVVGGQGRSVLPMIGGGTGGYGTSSGPAGSAGDWGSTPLQKSAQWGTGGNMGSFTYSYPLTPVPAAGPTPSVSLGYNSQAVDGMTSNTNNQGGILSPGWDLNGGGFIERSYRGCAGDFEPTTPTGGDWCWAGVKSAGVFVGDGWAGWSLNLNGQSSPMIKQSPYNFVLKDDPLWKISDATTSAWGSAGGSETVDNDGEHFTVKTPDGWVYEFGSAPSRNSVWAVPVIGNNASEPCNANAGVAKQCYQGWRFMLDKVTDPYGNKMIYTYTTDTNQYFSAYANSWKPYTRGGCCPPAGMKM